jgi:hypothetical protein
MQKKIEKMLETLRVLLKNLILIRHFGSHHNFWLIWQMNLSIHVAGKNTYKKQKANFLENVKVLLLWISAAILELGVIWSK